MPVSLLCIPIDYYEELFELIRPLIPANIEVRHHFQTNAMLINQAWCDFFLDNEARVGVSIDGPKYINDFNRLTRSGKSTFKQAFKGISLLKQNNISFHAIAVISLQALQHGKEIYDFFLNLGVDRLGINIEESEGVNLESSLLADPQYYQKVKSFFKSLYTENLNNDHKLVIRELENAKKKLLFVPLNDFSGEELSQQTRPFGIVSIDIQGNFSTFSP